MSDFEPFAALSFDCYGTLIDWETGIGAELEAWSRRHGVRASRNELVEAFAAHETAVQTDHPRMLYPLVLAHTLRRIGERLDASVTDEEAAAFGASVSRWPAFPDSADALTRLKRRFKLIILSNVDRASFRLSNARLGVEFDLIVTAEEVGAYKPSPVSFPAMLDRLESIGIHKSGLLHVAQSLYHDHEPARAVDLPTVWIDRRHDQHGPGATPPPRSGSITPRWRYPSMGAFADAVLGSEEPR